MSLSKVENFSKFWHLGGYWKRGARGATAARAAPPALLRVTQGYMLYPHTGYGYSKCAVSVIRGQHPVLYPLSVDSTCAVSAKYPKYADTFAFLHVAYRIRRRFLYPLYPRLCGVYPRLYAALASPEVHRRCSGTGVQHTCTY